MSRNGGADERARWAQSAQELLGKTVGGKYRIEKILGRGGMGTIYVAEQQPLGRRVALKVLHPTLGGADDDPEFQKRFLLEAATLSQLAHPNIVVVHDYGSLEEEQGACFMAMELLEGRTINQVLQEEGGRFEPARALRITRDIARALRAAHDLGVIHRDLKPSNVMLCPGPEGEGEIVKVLDFGLVKVMRDDSEELTAEGRFLGSPRYMSPEQIQRLDMDGRSDLYSLGVILYRMLAGEVPFAGDHAVQTLMAHLGTPVPPLSSHEGVQVPMGVEQLVMKLLEKSAANRYARAGDLIRAIDAVWPQLSGDPLLGSREHLRSLEMSGVTLDLTPTTGSYPVLPPSEQGGAVVIQPATPPRRPAWLVALVVVLGVAAGLGGAAGIARLLDEPEAVAHETVIGETPDEPRPEPPPPVERVEPPTADPPPVVEQVAERTTFTLTIRSVPAGATVYRAGEELGATPLTVELDRTLLGDDPARFTLRMRGREAITVEQGPSEANVEIERELPRLTRQRPPRETGGQEPPRSGGDVSIKTQR